MKEKNVVQSDQSPTSERAECEDVEDRNKNKSKFSTMRMFKERL